MAKIRGESIAVKVIEVDSQRQRPRFLQREGQKNGKLSASANLSSRSNRAKSSADGCAALQNFGAFIDLGPADGLIYISELAWYRVDHPRDVLKVGEESMPKCCASILSVCALACRANRC